MRCSTTFSGRFEKFAAQLTSLLLLLILSFPSISQAEIRKETDSFGLAHGWTREYDDTGQLRSEKLFEHGIQNGVSRLYYPSGELMTEWIYLNGLREGPSIGYFKSGKIKDRGFYIKDSLEGTVLLYYPNGSLKARMNFRNNVQDGDAETFDRKGNREHRYRYSKGRLLWQEDFDTTGKRIRITKFPELHQTP